MKILNTIEWAIDTVRDQLMFGLDPLSAAKSRERRAKGVLLDCKQKFKSIDEELSTIIKYYKDTYKDVKWDSCCSGIECACQGMPTDPEYYIYESLMRLDNLLYEEE